jgi:hypothetical protein
MPVSSRNTRTNVLKLVPATFTKRNGDKSAHTQIMSRCLAESLLALSIIFFEASKMARQCGNRQCRRSKMTHPFDGLQLLLGPREDLSCQTRIILVVGEDSASRQDVRLPIIGEPSLNEHGAH